MMMTRFLALLAVLAVPLAARAGGKIATGKGPCKDADQCSSGLCVEVNGDSYCSQACGDCPSGMYCDAQLFAMMSLKVCAKGSTEAPAKVEKAPPRLPCKTDKQCSGGLVCAEAFGIKDCTLPCTQETQCKMTEMMGVKMDFMTCAADQAKKTRKACLPKKECFANPMSCMSMNPEAMGAAMTGMMNMADGMEKAAAGASVESSPPSSSASTPAAAPARQVMDDGRFKQLLAQVKAEGFEDERNAVLETAAGSNYFTCAQIGKVLDVINMGDEKVSALAILAPRRVDRENSHTILAHFSFDDEKAKAKELLAR